MRKITRILLWLFVFTVPWDVVTLPFVGSASRLAGLAAIGAAALTTLVGMRFRKPDAILNLAIVFVVWSAMSLAWTVHYGVTYERVYTYAQLVLSLWMVRELVRTKEQQESLLIAFCLGAFVPMASLLRNFSEGHHISGGAERFSATGVNANDLGVVLVLGIPIAWHLILRRRGLVRLMAITYFALAPMAILLTGTRGSYLAAVVALLIVPATLPRQSLRTYALIGVMLILATVASVTVVPRGIWTRVASIQTEVLGGGRMTGRKDIWNAGMAVFPEHPVLGVGAGAYGPGTQRLLNTTRTTPHSVPLAVLVEGGLVGFVIFSGLLVACMLTILRMPPTEKVLWGVMMLTWLVGSATINWEYRKVTWLLFGMVSAQGLIGVVQARIARQRGSAGALPAHGDHPRQLAGA